MNQLISHDPVYRTALATLLITVLLEKTGVTCSTLLSNSICHDIWVATAWMHIVFKTGHNLF